MAKLEFVKMHGLGNDFVLIEAELGSEPLSVPLIRALAHRRTGVGFDQLLELTRTTDQDVFRMRIWNADGSEVAQCGNGARAAFTLLRDLGKCGSSCTLLTGVGAIMVRQGDHGTRVMLAIPEFEPAAIPLNKPTRAKFYSVVWEDQERSYAALSLGNPHAVFFRRPDEEEPPVERLGSWLNSNLGLFPDQVNVSFACDWGDGEISLRVFERGVGETLACGSAAAATAVAARLGGGQPRYRICFATGKILTAGWDGAEGSYAWIEGPATHVYKGTIELDTLIDGA